MFGDDATPPAQRVEHRKSISGEQPAWWQKAVVYQIYPRSFQDSDGDGDGDLRGILRRLDYLQDLGVDALWLSPIYPSPMADLGYDVSDYTGIHPVFGPLEDFRTLLNEAHRRGIRVLLDLVLNHTSDEHPWFEEAAASRQSPKRDWYIWHDGLPEDLPGDRPRSPNNWKAAFGGSAWEWEPRTRQFYLHSFLKEQPDVNWRNPGLREAMGRVIRFWLDLGVDGFRLDVVNWFIKDGQLRDNPGKLRGLRPYDRQKHIYDRNRPESVEAVKYIRSVLDEYPERMAVGEVYAEPPGDPTLAASYYGNGDGLHLAFNFAFTYCHWDARAFAEAVEDWEKALGPGLWPDYTLGNHDQPRALSRYGRRFGGNKEDEARARVAAAMLLTLRGTPFLYYGEEIGMKDGHISRRRLQDPVGRRYWPFHPGRDPARTPMQWSADANAGFSEAEPWLPVNIDYQRVNVEAQKEDPNSLLNWYKTLIRLRQREPALQTGRYRRLENFADRAAVFCYARETEEKSILVALNFTNREQGSTLPLVGPWEVLLGDRLAKSRTLPPQVVLQGYEIVIASSDKY